MGTVDSTAVTQGLQDFYKTYIVTATDQTIQVFQSFSYGEMTISALVLTFLFVYMAKWCWEVLR
jgi:hypothetical protein